MKKIVEKSLDSITRNGEKGFFIPGTIFDKEDCIIIINTGSDTSSPIEKIVKDDHKILIYSRRPSKNTKRTQSGKEPIILKPVKNKSPLFRSLNRSFNEIIKFRVKGKRPKTFEAFLDEL